MGYQRRVHGAFFSGFYLQELRMKTINISQQVAIPDGIKCSVKARTVTVTGPRGSLTESFRHLKVDICKVDKKTLKVEKWFGLRKELAAVRTICSHISNMIVGVTKGYQYKMRAVYAHFPINCAISENNSLVEVRNFLGERSVCTLAWSARTPARRTSWLWRETTSRPSPSQPPSSSSRPPSRTRTSESSSTACTSQRGRTLLRMRSNSLQSC